MSQNYKIRLTGTTALLVSSGWYDISDEEEAEINVVRREAGGYDDMRRPGWCWLNGLTWDEAGVAAYPGDFLAQSIRKAAASVGLPKEQADSIRVEERRCPIATRCGVIPRSIIAECKGIEGFVPTLEHVQKGYSGLSAKVSRVRLGNQTHVRVTPRFEVWEIAATVTTEADDAVMRKALARFGKRFGIGDWNKSSRSPGVFGSFDLSVA